MNILKFNINRSSILTKSLLLLLLLFVVGRGEIWGFGTYYAKMTVGKSSGYSGSGTVYVSNASTNNPTYGDGNTVTSSGTSSSGGSQTFYLYAKANDNNLFLGWTNSSNGTSAESTNNPYQKSVSAGTDDDDDGTKSYNYYAIFAKAPSVKVTATAGTGGTVNVSNSSTAGTYGSSSELTQYADALPAQSKTFYLFAQPNSGYAFNGWTGASVASSSSNNTTLAVNTPSNDGGTSTYTVTANFVPYWYYNVKAQAILSGGTAGGGNVYIGTSSSGTPSAASMTASENTKYAATQPSAVRLYVKATATSGYEFVGWSESPTATTGNTATTYYDVAYTQGVMPSNPTKTYYAVFKQLQTYHFKAEAKVSGNAGGTATATPATASIQATTLSQTSATKSDFTFTATPAAKYSFSHWSNSENGESVSTNNPYTNLSITSTSTDPNAPTTKTLYANFTPFPTFYFKAAGAVSPAGSGTVSVTGSTLSKQADSAGATSLTMTTSYTATSSDPELYTFAGWKSSTSASSYASTANPADLTLTSTSKSSTSPITTTWYAIFTKKADVTSISLTQSSMTLKQKQSASIAYSLLPSGCYEKLEFASNNTAVATVNSSGSVKGVSQGSTTVTVKAYKTDKTSYVTATVNVTVTNEVASQVGMTFTEGTTPGSLSCFDSFNIPNINLTVSNCIIMPGRHDGSRKDPDGNVIVDFKGTLLEGGQSVKLTGNQQLDCETFYFENSSSMPDASQRAYSFTGWHITNTPISTAKIPAIVSGKKVPAQTVFQPGDVITPEVLKDYGVIDENGGITGIGLTFEALWGQVCFISFNENLGAAEGNDGKSYKKPMWSTAGAINQVSTSDDAYSAVLMVLDYYGFSDSWTTVSERGVTYKSLQRSIASNTVGAMEDGRRYTIKTTSGTNQPTGHASYRLDNVKGVSEAGIKSIKMDKGYYIETTARFSGNIGNFLRIENQKIDFVGVLNGGRINGSETFSWSRLNEGNPTQKPTFNHRYFYFGRNVSHGHFFTSCSGTYSICTGPVYTTITGGYMEKYSGTGTITHTNNGDRYLYIYGDKSGNQEYDPKIGLIQPAGDSKLNGNSYVTIAGTTQLNDVYGGGYSYSATVNNAYLDIKESIINGSAYGGGCYGSTTGEVKLNITNSTVKGNVFGSGMGATSLVSYDIATTTKQYDNNTTIPVSEFTALGSLDGFPLYYTAETLDGTLIHPQYSVLAYKLYSTTVWGGDNTNKNINLNLWAYTYHLAMAEAGSTSITINGSTIGTESKKGLRTNGNVYGGGAIAKVLGNSDISISNTTVYSSVYGGGDGIATPDPVYLTTPALAAVTTTPSAKDARESDAQEDLQRPNPVEDPDKWTAYEWTSDISVWNMGGIDHTNHKIYSPNNASNGWGDVSGKTQVTVQGGSHVYGSVYGGGNAGKVGPDSGMLTGAIVTSIENSTVDGSVYGGCNNAEMKAATQVRILGNSTVGNVYGGGNAGVVQGTTNVQIGQ